MLFTIILCRSDWTSFGKFNWEGFKGSYSSLISTEKMSQFKDRNAFSKFCFYELYLSWRLKATIRYRLLRFSKRNHYHSLDAKRRKLEEKSTIFWSDHTIDKSVSKESKLTNREVMKTRKEKRKLRVIGKKVVEVVWSPQIRFAFLVHLLCRICIELLLFSLSMMIQVILTLNHQVKI